MQPSRAAKTRSSRPVLLVESDVAQRERLYDLLTRHGFSVIAVHSCQSALDTLKHERPGLILADAALADTTGWDMADRIRSFDTQVPIVLLGNSHPAPSASLKDHQIQALLPQDIAEDRLIEQVERSLTADPRARPERWPGTVLIVDDEPKLRNLLQEFLQGHGFTVVTTASGEEALARCQQAQPAVVLLDFRMPGMDGLVTLKKLKALQPSVTVILITGLEEEDTMQQALALGADDYILKPFNLDYLETVLLAKLITGQTP